MIKGRSLALALSMFSGFSALTHAETLQEIYMQAVENDHIFKAAQATLEAGLENKTLGRSGLLPQISADASWTDSETDTKSPDLTSDSTITEGSVTLRQSIIDFSSWYEYKRGDTLASLAEANFRSAEQSLVLRTARAYFNALNAVDNLTTAVAEENALFHQLEQSKQRFEVGLTAITEVHEAQAAYDSATANRLVAEGNLGIAFEALEVITGQPYLQLAPVKDQIPTTPPTPADRTFWVTAATENSADLAAAKLRMQAAKEAAKIARSGHLPTVTGSLSYTNQDRDGASQAFDPLNPLTPTITQRDGVSETTVVQLKLSIPLFSGGSTSASRRQAYSQYIAELENYKQTQRTVTQDTRTTYLNVLTSAAAVKARKQAIISSQSALEATQAGYDVGTRDLVDVLNAQRSLYASQRNFYDALYTYIIATLELREAAGILGGDDIAQLEQWLDPTRSSDYKNK